MFQSILLLQLIVQHNVLLNYHIISFLLSFWLNKYNNIIVLMRKKSKSRIRLCRIRIVLRRINTFRIRPNARNESRARLCPQGGATHSQCSRLRTEPRDYFFTVHDKSEVAK